jgi:uncharacterized membrane protein
VDFWALVTHAWRITWRTRAVWVFGLFAGGTGGGISVSNPASAGRANLNTTFSTPQVSQAFQQVQEALPGVLSLLIGALAVGAVVWLVFVVVAALCQAAVIVGGRDLAEGRTPSTGDLWRLARASFGRLLALDLVLAVLWIAAVAGIVLIAIGGRPLDQLDVLGVILALASGAGLLTILASVIGVVVAYAQREIVLNRTGIVDGLARALRLARRTLATTFFVWLIGVVLSIVGAFALGVAILVLLIPAGIVGLLAFALTRAAPALGTVVLVVDGLAFGALFCVALAVLHTFQWHYWTLAYLRLQPEAPPSDSAITSGSAPQPSV